MCVSNAGDTSIDEKDGGMTGKIGLVGLGLVGTAMAERLLAEGFEVAGFDIDEARCKHLEELGGKAAGSPAEAAQQVNPVILSLPDTQVVLQVVEGPGGDSRSEKSAKLYYRYDNVRPGRNGGAGTAAFREGDLFFRRAFFRFERAGWALSRRAFSNCSK